VHIDIRSYWGNAYFELDIAPTQKRKIEILNDEKIDIPEQVTLSASILELTNLKMF